MEKKSTVVVSTGELKKGDEMLIQSEGYRKNTGGLHSDSKKLVARRRYFEAWCSK